VEKKPPPASGFVIEQPPIHELKPGVSGGLLISGQSHILMGGGGGVGGTIFNITIFFINYFLITSTYSTIK
jgi:hypothetical protein